ncbi:MAG: archease [Candidatus Omnitrophota bacterium]
MRRYEQVPHTADFAARIYGKDLPELFENAAFAMFDIMADLEGLQTKEAVNVQVEADDKESLLISWLNEILYIAYIKGFLFGEFNVKSLAENKLTAEVRGEKLKGKTDRFRAEIKAATYHDLEIIKTDTGYEVTIVFDV